VRKRDEGDKVMMLIEIGRNVGGYKWMESVALSLDIDVDTQTLQWLWCQMEYSLGSIPSDSSEITPPLPFQRWFGRTDYGHETGQ
jgi:hypothetical protein